MDLVFFIQLVQNVLKELWRHKFLALFSGVAVAFAIQLFGVFFWQAKYEVSSTLYADQQNIIQPLLEGKAHSTDVEDKLQIVTDLMLSRKALEKLVVDQGFVVAGDEAAAHAAAVSSLRKRVKVELLGPNYIGVSFADVDPDRTFNVVNDLVEFFISESSANKRSESKQAYMFIDRQANAYKEQLREAEDKLKQFKATHLDGGEGMVAGKIEALRTEISDIELDLEQVHTREASLVKQVEREDQYLTRKAKAEEYKERLVQAVSQLDTLRLSLTDNHPDVINMLDHIEGLKQSLNNPEASRADVVFGNENPVYDKLREQLAEARVEKNSVEKRLRSLRTRLDEEHERAKRIAEKNAELSELTRDYDVTKGLYEDLLERKERARLSMTLDIEGQGVTYKIQEPAKYPLSPSGLTFAHFVLLGCLAAISVPVGLAVVYVMLDPRVRFPSTLAANLDVPILGVVPHMVSGPIRRARQRDVKSMVVICLGFLLLYFGLTAVVMLQS